MFLFNEPFEARAGFMLPCRQAVLGKRKRFQRNSALFCFPSLLVGGREGGREAAAVWVAPNWQNRSLCHPG